MLIAVQIIRQPLFIYVCKKNANICNKILFIKNRLFIFVPKQNKYQPFGGGYRPDRLSSSESLIAETVVFPAGTNRGASASISRILIQLSRQSMSFEDMQSSLRI